MLKVFAAAALTIICPLILMAGCYAVSCIPPVKRMLDVDENDSIFIRSCEGLAVITICILGLVSILILLISLFVMFYNLL